MARGEMLAAVLHGKLDLRLEHRPIPLPGPGQVLVRIVAVGICGSDVHFWKDGRIGTRVVERPMILGHECAGEVVALGEGVAAFQVGDRVALEPGIPCGFCPWCRTGRYNLCPQVRFLAAPPTDGALAEYVAHPAALTYKLPAHLSYEEGALLEPLSVGLHAVERAGVRVGDRVLIAGAGPIGLVNLFAAKAHGASQVYLTDIRPHRLELACRLGAEAAIDARETPGVQQKMQEFTEGYGVDIALDCSGSSPGIDD
ncbi:MAG: NAD(P)-dependent alcohol dehydrogenase, partial [Chloroflexota bacterium]|nr:NAD(P)-dependent alcohol dehydrogenase [Chloroflexota bacterium]